MIKITLHNFCKEIFKLLKLAFKAKLVKA